ncbi:Gfo/Idh/MocA family oxidoreductase [Candidatus Pelagibacter sp.]|nr:Gfo/Idh/MocA family oxidoreductase [Candidatus Pelagibacter sp.]
MKQNINWGIIGLGNIATVFAESFKGLENAKLISISSKNQHKLKIFKEKLHINQKYCFDNYEDLLNCDEVDIVYIALPNSLHHEWIIKCIENKKNILVEKPATINLNQIEDIKKKLSNKKLFFTEAFMYRYAPHISKLIELIKTDKIGRPVSMESDFGKNILIKKNILGFNQKKKQDKKNRIYNKELGGGAILDLGCYPVSLSTLIASTFSKINYDKIKVLEKSKEIGITDVDLDSYAKLEFDKNFISKVRASFLRDLGDTTTVIGTKGKITIKNTWYANPATIILEGETTQKQEIDCKNNIYSYEIVSISKSILHKSIEPNFPNLSIDEIIGNTKILEKWLS